MHQFKMNVQEPTLAQVAELCAYRDRHGRRWKSRLLADWLKPHAPDGSAELRQIRNAFGPSWLLDYRLPDKIEESTRCTTE